MSHAEDNGPTSDTTLDHALAYARRGWRVIPIPRGRKHPAIPAWQTAGTTDEARIRHWWTTSPDDGIGIVTGPASGVWVLDVDVADGKAGDDTLAELIDTYGELPDTYEVITGSGGRHIYFAWPDGVDVRNSASGVLGPGLDVRGDGGQVLAPPTIHPNGTPYEVEASAPDHVAQAPGWLLRLLTPEAPARPLAAPTGTTPVGDRPGDLWAAQTTWADLLGADGWTLHHVDRDGEEHWTRPGKDRREGTSATVGYRGSDVLKVFTSSIPALRAEETYTKLGYLAATRHHGDHSAAAKALRADGWHTSPVDLDAPIVLDGGAPAAPSPDDPWPTPIPLGGTAELPPFPVRVLPDWIADFAAEVADDLQVPVDLPAMLALGALSTIAAGRIKVKVHGRWVEHANVYIVVAMPPSTGKSPAYKAMCGPITLLEAEHQRMMRATVQTNRDIVDSIESEIKRVRSAPSPDRDELERLNGDLIEAQDKPTSLPKFTVGDATPEALAKLIADNGGRMAVHSTEGGVFDLMAGRYSDRANLDVYLQAWSGDRIDTARIGREGNQASEALLTMVLTVQPSVIAALAERPELAGRGLTARFMYAVPPDVLGNRDLSLRAGADDVLALRYEQELMTLGRRLLSWETPATIVMTPEAAQHYTDWRQALEDRRRPDGDLRPLAEWTGKLESSVVRCAALLHLAWGKGAGEAIDLAGIAQAIAVGEYWLAHAGHVHDMWGTSPDIADARMILDWAARKGVTSFTARDLYAANRARFRKADDVLPGLGLLTERGWCRTEDGGPVATQRNKRSVVYVLHPEFSTVSARSVPVVPSHIKSDLSLSFHGDMAGRTHAQNAQNAQNDPGPNEHPPGSETTTERSDDPDDDEGSLFDIEAES